MVKIMREKFKTYEGVFDEFTLRKLFKLSTQGHFDELKSPVALGKESNVYSAVKSDKTLVAVKIYRLETCDFNKMYNYIRTDPRFVQLKKQKRKVIFEWAKREFQNLMRAREAGIKVPTPLTFSFNILVMEFIGGSDPAPKLKDLPPNNPRKFLEIILNYYSKLYHKARLVHGDLSEFNILNHNEKPVIIDFSQSTLLNDPHAKEYFKRDMKNLSRFFSKQGLEVSEEDLIKRVLSKDL